MINVGRVVTSNKFAQPYTIKRQTGHWLSGRWITDPEISIEVLGTITAMNPNDLLQVPEGDRVTGIMCFYSQQPINVTNPTGTSDQIIWKNERYRVSSVVPWADFGYYKAFGIRMVSK